MASRGRRIGFTVMAAAVSIAYTILLPFDYTQRFSFANWDYLDPYQIAWSVVLGLGMAFVLIIQFYAMRQVVASSPIALSGVAFVTSLLPSLLCCTPMLPTLLTFVGLSTMQVYGTAGTLQYFFATHQTEFLTGSLLLLVTTAGWGLHRIAHSTCLTTEGCAAPSSAPRGDTEVSEPAAIDGNGRQQ
jgi:hypothetical protein